MEEYGPSRTARAQLPASEPTIQACGVCGRAHRDFPVIIKNRCECCCRGEYFWANDGEWRPCVAPCRNPRCNTCRDLKQWADRIEDYWTRRQQENEQKLKDQGLGMCKLCHRNLGRLAFTKNDWKALTLYTRSDKSSGASIGKLSVFTTPYTPNHSLGPKHPEHRGACRECRAKDGL